jgi:flavin-dependent dehydrogenase
MAQKNEEIAFHPYLAWHNNKGERVTEPVKLEIGESKDLGVEEEEDGPSKQLYRHSRPQFHLMLEKQLEMVGIKVQYGKRAIRYIDADPKNNEKAAVELDTGEIMEADVVIAADGVGGHSTKATLGHDVPARSTGHAIYRAAFPIEIVLSDPELAERFKLLPDGSPVAELWIG